MDDDSNGSTNPNSKKRKPGRPGALPTRSNAYVKLATGVDYNGK